MRRSSDNSADAVGEAGADVADMRIALVATKFNQDLVDEMLRDARTTLMRLGAQEDNLREHRVPGSLELPIAATWLCDSGEVDAVIALGVVIRGETPHFEYVCNGALQGLVRVSTDSGVPIMFGVLTTDTIDQAIARIRGPVEHKGADVAKGVVEMIRLSRSILASA